MEAAGFKALGLVFLAILVFTEAEFCSDCSDKVGDVYISKDVHKIMVIVSIYIHYLTTLLLQRRKLLSTEGSRGRCFIVR